MKIGKELKDFRIKQGISALGMSKAIGITNMTVSNIENGRTVPRWDNIEKICRFLGLHIQLMDKEGNIIARTE